MGSSLRDRLKNKKKEMKERSSGGKYKTIKEGITRARPAPVGDENDFAFEVNFIYLNKELGGFVSPSTFGEKCAFALQHANMIKSKSDKDRVFAKRIGPKKKYLMPHLIYKDEDGNDPDQVKLLLLTPGLYTDLIDLFLDTKENGDFTDPINGYDIKYERTGSTMTDTKYSLRPCRPTKMPKKFRDVVDLEKLVRDITPSYKETKEMLAKFMAAGDDDDKEEPKEAPKKKKKKDDDDDDDD